MTNQNSPFSMVAPGAQSTKRDDIQPLPVGPNVGIIYQLVDLGTEMNERFNKYERKIRIGIEFPLLKQKFRTTDTEDRPTVLSREVGFKMTDKSHLHLKFVAGIVGRTLQENEYKDGFDIGILLGKMVIVEVVNKPKKSNPAEVYQFIENVKAVTEHTKTMYNIQWDLVQRTNDLVGFLIDPQGQCFQSPMFAKMPDFLRNKIMGSEEGKAYAQAGGQFIPREQKDSNQQVAQATPPVNPVNVAPPVVQPTTVQPVQNAAAPPPVQPVSSNEIIEIAGRGTLEIIGQYSYESLKAANYTEDLMVEKGLAVWKINDKPLENPLTGDPVDPNLSIDF